MEKEELLNIIGGGVISSTIINSIVKGINAILELGRSLGSAVRRIQFEDLC